MCGFLLAICVGQCISRNTEIVYYTTLGMLQPVHSFKKAKGYKREEDNIKERRKSYRTLSLSNTLKKRYQSSTPMWTLTQSKPLQCIKCYIQEYELTVQAAYAIKYLETAPILLLMLAGVSDLCKGGFPWHVLCKMKETTKRVENGRK